MVAPVREDVFLDVLVEAFLHTVHVLEEVGFGSFALLERTSLDRLLEHGVRALLPSVVVHFV